VGDHVVECSRDWREVGRASGRVGTRRAPVPDGQAQSAQAQSGQATFGSVINWKTAGTRGLTIPQPVPARRLR
jgi:hypothetical protein